VRIKRKNDLKFNQLQSERTGEQYSLSSVLAGDFSTDQIFLSVEKLIPAARSSGAHYHSETDEIIYVLKGSVKVVEQGRENKEECDLFEGDSILFEKNSKKLHFLKNDSTTEAQVLVIRKNTENTDVIF
jgi:uncharacterized cupin superfamily protein